MRDQFWTLFYRIKFSSFYLPMYQRRIQIINNILDALSLLTSAASIAAWNIWESFPLIWSILLASAQVSQLIKPLLPYSKRLQALKFIIPELRDLADEMTSAWNHLSPLPDSDFSNDLESFQRRYTEIESKYLGSDSTPYIHRLGMRAMDDLENDLTPFTKECNS